MAAHAWKFLLLISLLSQGFTQEAPSQRAQVGAPQMEGRIVTKIAPIYPRIARQARIQGTVILQVQINKTGDVESMQLFSGHPMLAPAAIDAVKQWKYMPYLVNGEPVNVETRVTVNFSLPDKSPPEGVVGDAPGGFPPSGKSGINSSDPLEMPSAGGPRRVRISSGVAQGLLVTKVPPQYPAEAKEKRIEGVVLMRVNIDHDGNVYKVELISGHPLLAPAAMEAVKQWKYKPFLLRGEPIEVESQVLVSFTLGR
jgi:TonB family protein